jgi:hypothetical protein
VERGRREAEGTFDLLKSQTNKQMKETQPKIRVYFLFYVLCGFEGRPRVCSVPGQLFCCPSKKTKEEEKVQGPTKLLRAEEKLAVEHLKSIFVRILQ